MDEIAKIRAAKNFLTRMTKKSKPAEAARHGQLGDMVSPVLISLAANEMDREEAASFLHDCITYEREFSYIAGMLHGYAIAKGLAKSEKRKLQHKTIAKIKKGLAQLEKRTSQHKAFGEAVKDLANLEKRKPDYKAKIVQVLMNNPKAPKMKVARALDSAGIRLPKVKSLPKDKTLWKDIVETRYFKTLIRRASERAARAKHLRDCQERLDLIRMGAGVKIADILDLDTPLQPDGRAIHDRS